LGTDLVYTKVIVHDTGYNFVVEKLFYLKLFRVPNKCCKFADFEIQKYNSKVVVANLNYMFVVDKVFIRIRLESQMFVLN
jgi:hypothetical protein